MLSSHLMHDSLIDSITHKATLNLPFPDWKKSILANLLRPWVSSEVYPRGGLGSLIPQHLPCLEQIKGQY